MGQIGRTTRTARAILEVLRPLTGEPATGTALVSATAGDVVLPAGCFFAPLKQSVSKLESLDRENLVRSRSETIINASGVSVPIISMLGGVRQNIEAGTRLRVDPPLDGLETFATIEAPGMVGGLSATGPGSVAQALEFETITSAALARELFNARLQSGTPSLVLAWESSGSGESVARGAAVRPERWTLYVVTTRADGAGQRRDVARDILDAVESYLHDRKSVAGFRFSNPSTRVIGRSRLAVTKTSYVYAVQIETFGAVQRIDTRGATSPDGEITFTEWKTTQLDLPTADVPPFPVVEDVFVGMILGAFNDDFNADFDITGKD